MGDQVYRLIVDMSSRGSLGPQMEKVSEKAKGLDGIFDKVGSKVGGLAQSLSGAFTGAVEQVAALGVKLAAVGAGAGMAALTYGVVGLNSQLEQTQVSLGALFSVNDKANGMTAGIQLAGDVMKTMRKDAAELPGEFTDLLSFFRLGATPGFQAGASVNEMEKLSANAMATSAALGMDMHQGAREFAMLLQGRAGAHNVFGSLLGFSGDKAQEFNAKSSDARLADVTAALGKYEASRKAFATTFDALSSTFVDNSKKFLGTATAGVFEKVKKSLFEANTWFEKNETLVNSWGQAIGSKLEYAFEIGKAKLLEWGPILMDFAKGAYHEFQKIVDALSPLLKKLEPGAKALIGGGDIFGKMESTAGVYAALKLGTPMLSAGASAASGLGIGALPIAAGVGAAALGGAAMYSAATTTDAGAKAWDDIMSSLATTGSNLLAAFAPLTPALVSVVNYFGGVMLENLDMFVTGIKGVTGWLADMVGVLSGFRTGWNAMFGDDAKLNDTTAADNQSMMDDIHNRRSFEIGSSMMGSIASSMEAKAESKRPKVTGGGGTNIQKVEIVVSSNADPERIARLTMEKIQGLGRNRTSSPYVRNASANSI